MAENKHSLELHLWPFLFLAVCCLQDMMIMNARYVNYFQDRLHKTTILIRFRYGIHYEEIGSELYKVMRIVYHAWA